MSFTDGSFLSPAGPVQTVDNYGLILERYLPNLFVTIQLALLATLVDLVLGFPFAYILVRRVRYRDVVRADGLPDVRRAVRHVRDQHGPAARWPARPVVRGARDLGHVAAVQPAIGRVRDGDLHLPVHGHEHRDGAVERRPDARGGGGLPRRGAVRNVPPVVLPARSGVVAGSLLVFGWSIGAFAEPALLGGLQEQRSAVTIYDRGVVQNDYGLASAMGMVLLAIAFVVTYFSLRYSRGALAE